MISQKRIDAARANGALSRGPKTPEGKLRSARNATRHGLLSKVVVLRNENHDAFHALFNAYTERLGPLDDVEIGLVEEMVAAYWRLRRAFAIEMHMMDVDMDARPPGNELDRLTSSFSDLAASSKLTVLHRYQARLHLVHSRALRDLAVMRRELPAESVLPNEPNNVLAFNETVESEPNGEPGPDAA